MVRGKQWTRPVLTRLSTTGSAEGGVIPAVFETKYVKTIKGALIYGTFTPSP